MKIYLLLIPLLISCGKKDDTSWKQLIENQNKKIDLINNKLDVLQNALNSQLTIIDDLQNDLNVKTEQLNNVQNEIDSLENAENALKSDLNASKIALNSAITATNATISRMQTTVNNLQTQIANLNLNSGYITGIIDPCGDGSGFDQVILKTSDNKYITFVDDCGVKTLVVLSNNTSYQTQDAQKCNFKINSQGVLSF